jgi:hypothetical protein
MANHQGRKTFINGEIRLLKPGQFHTSVDGIVRQCKCKTVTAQKVRTALKNFEKYGFLTNESTNKGTVITIVNWRLYQSEGEEDNKQLNKHLTSSQQALNKHLTTNKNDKNIENDNNIIYQSINLSQEYNTPTPTPTQIDGIDGLNVDDFVAKLKDKIDYEDFVYIGEGEAVDNIINLAVDLILTKGDVVIGSRKYPKSYVVDKLLSMEYKHIDWLTLKLSKLNEDNSIHNPKRYAQSLIFNTALNYETEFKNFCNAHGGGDG